jgi:hypothetical protein
MDFRFVTTYVISSELLPAAMDTPFGRAVSPDAKAASASAHWLVSQVRWGCCLFDQLKKCRLSPALKQEAISVFHFRPNPPADTAGSRRGPCAGLCARSQSGQVRAQPCALGRRRRPFAKLFRDTALCRRRWRCKSQRWWLSSSQQGRRSPGRCAWRGACVRVPATAHLHRAAHPHQRFL